MKQGEAIYTIGAVVADYKKVHRGRTLLFALAAFGMGVMATKSCNKVHDTVIATEVQALKP